MNAGDEMRPETTIRVQDDVVKTAGTLVRTALDGDHPVVHLKGPASEVIVLVIGLVASAESDQQAQLAKTAADTDTAAIDTVTPATKTKDECLEGIEMRDHALAHRENHAAPHREHWNDAAPSPHSPTHSPTWQTLQMHQRQKNKSQTSTLLGGSQPKAIQLSRVVRK